MQAVGRPDVLSLGTIFGFQGAWLDLQVRLCVCVGICGVGPARKDAGDMNGGGWDYKRMGKYM